MLLTKKYLKKLLEGMWVSLPENREKELLEHFSELCIDDEGHVHDYTEQDIYENVRKVVQEEEHNRKMVVPDFLLKVSSR